MKKAFFHIALIFLAVFIISTNHKTFAKEILIEASGDYIMDSRLDETPASATARAREEAKRSATEQAGVYLQSYSKMVDFRLEHDEVTSIAARILKIQDEKSNVEVVQDNLLKFTVHIKALIDDNKDEMLKAMAADKQNLEEAVRQNKELQKEYDALKKQMEEIKQQYNSADDATKIELKKAAAQNSEFFNSMQELEKGNDFYLQKNYSEALNTYNNALKLNSKSAEIYNNRGLTYYHLHKLADALNDFNQAISLKSDYSNAYNNRGMVRQELNQSEDAIKDYTAAIQLNPNFVYALNNRGNAYATLGQYQNASQDLQAALRLADSNAEIHNNLGSVYFSMERYDEAIKEYTRAIQLNSNYAEAYYNRAAIYYGLGRYSEALADSKQALNLNPEDKEIKDLHSKILAKSGR